MHTTYIKDFDGRNVEKKKVNERRAPRVKAGEIWLSKVGVNIGSEIDGKGAYYRPVLVISLVGRMPFVAPLTTKRRDGKFFHVIDSCSFFDQNNQPLISAVSLGQCRIFDASRLVKFKDKISQEELFCIKKKLQALYLKFFD